MAKKKEDEQMITIKLTERGDVISKGQEGRMCL